jgi:hypothetical protein
MRSVQRSTSPDRQSCSVSPGQSQLPWSQIWPSTQATPQAPQLAGSSSTSMQSSSQKAWPAAQAQAPWSQIFPPTQARPQPPQ